MPFKKKVDDYSRQALSNISEKEKKLQAFEQRVLNASRELKKREELFKVVLNDYRNKNSLVAKMYADAFLASDKRLTDHLNWKKHPAYALSREIRNSYAVELRELRFKLKQYEYQLEEYKSLYPELEDGGSIQDLIDPEIRYEENPERVYLSADEWLRLSEVDKEQLALSRYLSRNHSNAHIGKMYERYIGYLYETQGYIVEYNGIEKGFKDSGIDLICKKNNEVVLIQCKYWSKQSVIYEKYIAQFFGSCKYFELMDSENNLFTSYSYFFYTTTQLDEIALKFASMLNIKVYLRPYDKSYPIIKCNINGNDKIYHLPFDQQYDKVKIKNNLECSVQTIKESKEKGFRRAKRWIGEVE